MTFVIDASAFLALLQKEPGADFVARHIRYSAISAVNLTEVIEKTATNGRHADDVMEAIARLEIEVVPFDMNHSALAAAYRLRFKGKNISLADCCCWALAAALHAPVVTGDRDWIGLDHGLDLRMIR